MERTDFQRESKQVSLNFAPGPLGLIFTESTVFKEVVVNYFFIHDNLETYRHIPL